MALGHGMGRPVSREAPPESSAELRRRGRPRRARGHDERRGYQGTWTATLKRARGHTCFPLPYHDPQKRLQGGRPCFPVFMFVFCREPSRCASPAVHEVWQGRREQLTKMVNPRMPARALLWAGHPQKTSDQTKTTRVHGTSIRC